MHLQKHRCEKFSLRML